MPDIFDQLDAPPKAGGDIFDQIDLPPQDSGESAAFEQSNAQQAMERQGVAPQYRPDWVNKTATATTRLASGLVPHSFGEAPAFVGNLATPVYGGVEDIMKAWRAGRDMLITDKSVEDIARAEMPEQLRMADAMKTPAGSQERYDVGAETIAQMLMGAGIVKGTPKIKPKEIPTKSEVNPPVETEKVQTTQESVRDSGIKEAPSESVDVPTQKALNEDALGTQGGATANRVRENVPTSATPPAITEAAIRTQNGEVYTGRIHPEIEELAIKKGADLTNAEMGFIDANGKFVTRQQAYRLAVERKQIDPNYYQQKGGQEDWLRGETFDNAKKVQALVDQRQPIPSFLVDEYKQGLPVGYEKRGRDYVFTEQTPSVPSGNEAGAQVGFRPSTEWQEVPDGTVLPNGGEYRFDQATGKNFARWKKENLPQNLPQEATAESRQASDSKPQDTPGRSGEGRNVPTSAPTELQSWELPQPETIPPAERVNDPDPFVSRIANRYSRERAEMGEIGEVAPGEGYATTDLVKKGLRMSPEQVTQHVSDVMRDSGNDHVAQAAAIRAEEARLSDRSTQMSKMAEANPHDMAAQHAANTAFQDLTDFHNGPVAKLKQRFHAAGMALQGEIPVDLSTFNGLREAWLKDNGRAAPAQMEPVFKRVAGNVRRAIAEENVVTTRLGAEIEKATKGRKLPSADEVRNSIRERLGLGPCRI